MAESETTDLQTEDSVRARAACEKFPTPAYSEYVLTDCFEDAKRLFLDALVEVDCAHAVMLAEAGIITPEEYRSLAAALEGLERGRVRAAAYDGSFEDLFFYIES